MCKSGVGACSVVTTHTEPPLTLRKSEKALPTKIRFAKPEVGPGNVNLY